MKTSHEKKVYLAVDAHAGHCVMGVMRKDGEWLGEERFLTSAKEPNISCVKMARGQYA